MTQGIDVTKLTLMLNELRLPTIKQLWPTFAERSDKEGWPAARFLSAITEHEIAERGRRRMERHLAEAKLLPGKNARYVRLRRGSDDIEGAGDGDLCRRQLARKMAQI